ncbi:MAG: dTDP-4-dehydrorhamnose reductase [Candidatus Omnitrophica bacterium]|nr:dTDP-4-dehydrorhamnose reductase [Candidatus Omnitrophota bacterium]MDD5310539.1 dTDP-4-dehydrorhamnose reductase [Candidatus Omnitrophota bacterium]MDD5546035.1 dTDP-4-dehydrorhamnose reductase [Candidatus Omnitrophota bacterium]
MKTLITGATGMLGCDLCREFSAAGDVAGLTRGKREAKQCRASQLLAADITDRDGAARVIRKFKPGLVINAAALADVDFCELNPEEAFKTNTEGAKNVADAAEEAGALLIQISTDYVFDGDKGSAYTEEDKPNPLSVYGDSKLAADDYVRSNISRYAIVRSSWMFGPCGKNFVDFVVGSAKKGERIRAVGEKYGNPTYTADLAKAVFDLSERIRKGKAPSGIYNISNEGVCSRYELAKEIAALCGLEAEIVSITAKDAGGPAPRPKLSALDNTKAGKALGYKLRHYREALKEYIKTGKKR